MCNSANKLADGSLVACRKCGQCRSNRIDEWAGRCIAESKTSVATSFITLTYGRDEEGNESHARAAILTYSDVQKYFKQLRNRGYPCRYLMVGELGSKKGRAHWHGIVFWQEHVPQTMTDYGRNSWHREEREVPVEVPIVWDKRFNEPCWPHGFSQWSAIKYNYEKGSVNYVCKYINKDVDDPTAQSKLAMSKKPPIGTAYFIERARKFVDARIAPQDPFFQFPGQARRQNGNVINFMLRGKLEEIFCEEFICLWRGLPARSVYGPVQRIGRHYPASQYIEEYEDRMLRKGSGEYEYLGRRAGEKYYERHPNEALGGHLPWRDEDRIDVIDPYQDRYQGASEEAAERLRVESRHAPQPNMTRLGWVEKLANRGVFWISTSVTSRGRYSLVKHPGRDKPVWMRSLTDQKKRGSIASSV